MAAKFFVTGLPRSRTAWIANLLTTDNSFCHHDGLRNCNSLSEFDRLMDSHDFVGNADSGLWLAADKLSTKYPDARWVVIQRNPTHVMDSMLNMKPYIGQKPFTVGYVADLICRTRTKLDDISTWPGTLTLHVDELNFAIGACELFDFCLEGSGAVWDPMRYAMLRDMRITAMTERLTVNSKALVNLLRDLLE